MRRDTSPFTRVIGASLVTALLAPPAFAASPHPDEGASLPAGGPPRLEHISAREAQADWMAVKGLGDAARQLDTITKKRLVQKACDDLVDLRALSEAGRLPGFDFRDNVRGRSWARPTLALVLREAMKRFQADYPGRSISIGDVSQPGCGQVAHGVLVKDVAGDDAARLLAAARLELGELTVVEVKRARDFPWEADRFGPPEERVLVTTRLVAKEGSGADLRLRTARTRHRELAAPTADETRAFEAELKKLLAGKKVAQREVVSQDAAGVATRSWLSHYVAGERQAVVVSRQRPGKALDWAEVVEVRVAKWDEKKPGSFPDEVRWAITRVAPLEAVGKKKKPTPITNARFERWALLYEAGHITHLSGIDADLSYVTKGDGQHFAVDLDALDVPATLRWLAVVVDTARQLGTPVDAILVDRKIKAHFEKNLPKKGPGSLAELKRGPVWRLLTIVGGHDAHHHLRIVEASVAKERAARAKLDQ